ncbi:MAG TPA: hypothetical protein VF121_02825 [Thermoanaerobaculia bacterium]|nr:hypothetical protein [Thermoanaerobaculia bacterium]
MPTTSRVREDLAASWARVAKELKSPFEELPDFAEFVDGAANEETAARTLLEPWLAVFEVETLWLLALHAALTEDCKRPADARVRSTWLYSGYLCTQATALRSLCLSGLGPSAGILLRTIIEATRSFVLILDDSNLAAEFIGATNADARSLWRKQLSGRGARSGFERALTIFPADLREEIIKWFDLDSGTYSQLVHPTSEAAFLACFPLAFDSTRASTGVIGRRSLVDWHVLERASKILWFLSRFLSRSLLGLLPGHARIRNFDSADFLQSAVKIGFYVLGEVSLRYWTAEPPGEGLDSQLAVTPVAR